MCVAVDVDGDRHRGVRLRQDQARTAAQVWPTARGDQCRPKSNVSGISPSPHRTGHARGLVDDSGGTPVADQRGAGLLGRQPSAAVEPAGAEDLGGASRLAERSGHAGAGVALADVEAGDAGRGRGGPEAGHLHHPDTGRATEGGAAVSASGSVTSVHRNSANAVPLRRAMISAISRYPAWPRWATRCPGTQPGSASVAQISGISGMSGISAGRPWS